MSYRTVTKETVFGYEEWEEDCINEMTRPIRRGTRPERSKVERNKKCKVRLVPDEKNLRITDFLEV